MFNEELSDFAHTVLPALAIPIVIIAWLIHIISNRIVDRFCEEENTKCVTVKKR